MSTVLRIRKRTNTHTNSSKNTEENDDEDGMMGIKRFSSQNIDYMVLSITQIMPDNYTTLSYGT